MLLYGKLYLFMFVSLTCSLFLFLLVSSCSVVPHKQITSINFFPDLFEALYTYIRTPISLLFSRVGSFSLESLSSLSKFLRLGTIFVPAICNFPSQ